MLSVQKVKQQKRAENWTIKMGVNIPELDLVIPKYLRCKLTGELLSRPSEHVTDEKPRLKEVKGHSKTGLMARHVATSCSQN